MKHLGWTSGLSSAALMVVCAIGLVAAGSSAPVGAPGAAGPAAANKYVGAGKCKNCHKSDAGGNQYAVWEGSLHAKAFETLGTPAAKETATKLGIEDPQKSEKCLKCHVTAFGVAAEELASGFKPEMGVQCESCHGAGEQHMKARFAAAAKAKEGDKVVVPAGEINTDTQATTCIGCHNKESPNFKAFCFNKFKAKIRHLDPRVAPSDERKAKLDATCKCGDDCGCSTGADDPRCSGK